jgi:hypothetical protein
MGTHEGINELGSTKFPPVVVPISYDEYFLNLCSYEKNHDILKDMESGKYRIERVLSGDSEISESSPKIQAFRLILLVLILCQFAGLVLSQCLGSLVSTDNRVPLGMLLGALAALGLLVLGSRSTSIAGGSPFLKLGNEFYLAATMFLRKASEEPVKTETVAVEVVAFLLDHGITAESRLETHLSKAGFPPVLFQPALRYLEARGFINVRANGVTLTPSKRRLFLL